VSETEQEIAEQMGDDEELASEDESTETGEDTERELGTPTEDVAAAPRSQAEIEAVTKKLEAEAVRHEKRLREIMGEDFGLLVPSPVDWTPGYIFNVPGMLPAPEQVAALHALLGDAHSIDLEPALDAEACDACHAFGEVLTGSRKPGQETKPCSACGGTGWKPKIAPPAPVPIVGSFPTTTGTEQAAPNQFQVADRWGRPFGHPHYNMEPAQVGG
jgi:hypothetical protein